MLSNKKLNPVVTELFVKERKLNIFLAFFTQSYYCTHYFIQEIPNKRKL